MNFVSYLVPLMERVPSTGVSVQRIVNVFPVHTNRPSQSNISSNPSSKTSLIYQDPSFRYTHWIRSLIRYWAFVRRCLNIIIILNHHGFFDLGLADPVKDGGSETQHTESGPTNRDKVYGVDILYDFILFILPPSYCR